MEGARGTLYLTKSHYIKFKVGIGRKTNNKVKLMATKLVFILLVDNTIQKLQIMGDSNKFALKKIIFSP
jgi:hypothetical protein